jgi:hypothetical protein
MKDSSEQQLCGFFARNGHCRYGSACRFSHELGDSIANSSMSLSTRDPDLRQCDSMEELVQLAHEHLDTISPRGIAAFWSLLVKHPQNQHGDGAYLS